MPTQPLPSQPMNRRFHPWLAEIALGARNRIAHAQHNLAQTLFRTAAWMALGGLAIYGFLHLDGDRTGVLIRLLLDQPLIPVLLFGAFGFAGARVCTSTLLHNWRHGWWGALPVAPDATTRTLRFAATLFALAQLGIVILAMVALAAIAEHWHTWLAPMLGCAVVGLMLGALAGHATVRQDDHTDRPVPSRADSTSQPLFILPRIARLRLPYLAHWQRREALRLWRHGGGGWPFLLLGAIVPMNEAPASLAGLLLLGSVLIWFGTALRAATEVVVHADAALAATPRCFRDFAVATARYPMLVAAATAGLGGIGLVLQDGRWPFVPAFCAMPFGVATLRLAIAWRHRGQPQYAGLRFAVDIAMVVALGAAWLPLAPATLSARVIQHYRIARSTR